MKRFNFRLERVLQLKRQRERQAELRQRQAQSQAEAARAQLRVVQQHMNREALALAAPTAQPVTASARIAAMHYLSQLQRIVEVAESQVRKAEQQLHEATIQRATIHREVESLTFLRRGQWQEHKRAAAQAMQQQLDDMSMRRWQLSRASCESEPQSKEEVTEL